MKLETPEYLTDLIITENTLKKTGFTENKKGNKILVFNKAKDNYFDLLVRYEGDAIICYTRNNELEFTHIPNLISYIEGVKHMLMIFTRHYNRYKLDKK